MPPLPPSQYSADVNILLLEDETANNYKNQKTSDVYDTLERFHNLSEYNPNADKLKLTSHWSNIATKIGMNIFVFYGTLPAFREDQFNWLINRMITLEEKKPIICILLGCRTRDVANENNQDYNSFGCYFVGIDMNRVHHKYNKVSVLCTKYSQLPRLKHASPVREEGDLPILKSRRKFIDEFVHRNCVILSYKDIVTQLLPLAANIRQGIATRRPFILNKNHNYFKTSNLKSANSIKYIVKSDYENKYEAWLKSNFDVPIPVYPDGVYQGENMFGKRFGEGKMTYTNGDVYEGEWEDDVRTGDGKMTYKNGYEYEGEWEHDKQHGKGKMYYYDNLVYDGVWANGFKVGKGEKHYDDKNVYKGEFIHEPDRDIRHGFGTMRYSDDTIYIGDWSYDKREGVGRLIYTPMKI